MDERGKEMTGFDADGFDPTRLIRPGRFDPLAILLLWCGRTAFFPLLWSGLLVVALSGQPLDELGTQLDTLGEVVQAVFTPLVGVVIAVVFRVVVGFLGVAASYPLTRMDFRPAASSGSRVRTWQDRYFRTVAYTDLRRTWAVRNAAIEQLGATGNILGRCDPILRWLGVLTLAALTVAVIARLT